MKKFLLVVCASLVSGSIAFATVGPALLDSLSSHQARQIERLLEAKARKEIGTPMIHNFKVDWEDGGNRCLEATSAMDDSVQTGVCTLKFHGFQVVGTAALIIKSGSYEVLILQADLE